MKEALFYVLNSLVEKPENVVINYETDGEISRFKIKVDDSDRGKVIGKDGRVVKAVRNVFGIIGRKSNQKVFIEIV
ncbi:MAG: RNA-binding protein [Elusimicrobia bacterium CG08_land_8_20_14_0_20_51_18]|nr:MAG: RNA-binding protein [Elusimicrobia bacterium CG08_land_8_20_14_0_20_51_18]